MAGQITELPMSLTICQPPGGIPARTVGRTFEVRTNFQLRASPSNLLTTWPQFGEHVYHRFIKSAELITRRLFSQLFSVCCFLRVVLARTTAAQKSNAQVNWNYHFIIAARYFLFSVVLKFGKTKFLHSLPLCF